MTKDMQTEHELIRVKIRRRVVERFLINQKACSCNIINRNDGANFPAVYSVFVANK